MKKFTFSFNKFDFFYIFLIIFLFIITVTFSDIDDDTDYDFLHKGNDIFDERKVEVKRSKYIPAQLGKFPFVVAVFNGRNKKKLCGGIVLTDLMILTAGYCINECKDEPEMISILGGVVDMKDHVRDQWRYGSEIIFYNKSDMETLVGIKVNSPFYVHYLLQARPTPLAPFISNNSCYLSSWHLKDKIRAVFENENDTIRINSSVLKYVPAHPIDGNLCFKMYLKKITENKSEEILCLPEKPVPEDGLQRSATVNPNCVESDGTILSCSNPNGILIPIGIATYEEPGTFFCTDKDDVPTKFFDLGKYVNWITEKLFISSADFDELYNFKTSTWKKDHD